MSCASIKYLRSRRPPSSSATSRPGRIGSWSIGTHSSAILPSSIFASSFFASQPLPTLKPFPPTADLHGLLHSALVHDVQRLIGDRLPRDRCTKCAEFPA